MTEQVHDYTVRQQALQPDASFIIQAPAGSGKTGLLIKRYLRLLSLVDAPEEIIAITFTRKAAAEMQGRILQALNNALNNVAPKTDHDSETHALATAALQRDREKGWEIISNPGRLHIQTIDSLCGSLTRQMPVLAQLGTQPELIEDARPLFEQAAINTLAELESGEGWSESIANLVFHLDNDLPRIKQLIIDMLLKRDQWLGYVLQQHERSDMEQALTRLVEEQLQLVKKKFPVEIEGLCLQLLRYAGTNLQKTNPDNPLAEVATIEQFPGGHAEDLSLWRAIRELFLTRDNKWRSPRGLTIKCGFPAASEKGLDAEAKDHRQTMKRDMETLLQDLQLVDGMQPMLESIAVLPSANYNDAEWHIVNALCELLRLAAAQLNLLFAERNQMDFIGIAERALQALGTDEAPTELARHLDYQVRHLLVDEFQDVSMSQARLVKALTREWSLDDGRTLFLVGDPMQSIYRFREADVSIFIRTFHDACLGHVPLTALKLGVNFRSQQSLISWINASFKTLFPSRDDTIAGAVSYSESKAFDRSDAADSINIYPFYGRVFDDEAEKVAEVVEKIQRMNPQESIAILVRGRTHLREIIPSLREQGMRFKAIDIERLNTRPAIQDLMALTRAWLYPADRVAWLTCLRAPWCGLNLESLYLLCHENKHGLIVECLEDSSLLKSLSKPERQRAERFISVFKQAWSNRQRTTLRVAIESVWCQLGGPATLNAHNDLLNCDSFFNLLEKIERGGSISRLEELLNGVDELYAAPDEQANQQLQVMTIHKAKGLEFDHVILPGLGRATRNQSDALLVWSLRERADTEDLILAPIREAGEQQSAIYRYINHTDKEKQRYEDQRLLYVACTRSKKTLHLLGHTKLKEDKNGDVFCEPDGRSLLACLWSSVVQDYQQSCPQEIKPVQAQAVTMIDQNNSRLTNSWALPRIPDDIKSETVMLDEVQQEDIIEFEWAGETIKHIGSVVHGVLQWIAEEGLTHWQTDRVVAEKDNFATALSQLGVPADELGRAVDQVCRAVSNTLEDERGQWLLSDSHQAQRNEYAVSGLYEGTVVNAILDRTFIDAAGIRWIIDYKTSRHEGTDTDGFLDQEKIRYQDQLHMYGHLLQQLGEKDIRLALYFPLLQGWREWSLD